MTTTVDLADVLCECCGSNRPVTINFKKGEPMTAICELCDGLMQSGLVRLDGHRPDGTRLYRHWRQEWTPGELVRT